MTAGAQLVLRALAPLVVLSTIAVLASGVWVVAARPGHASWVLAAHRLSFIAWFGVMSHAGADR